jgi:RTX calcium-binding nonapeptide repeat (4 copies)
VAVFFNMGAVLDGSAVGGSGVGGSGVQLLGLSDLQVVGVGGVAYLLAGSEVSGAITSFALAAGVLANFRDMQGYTGGSGTGSLGELTTFRFNGEAALVPNGRYEDRVALYTIDAGGGLAAPVDPSGPAADFGGFYASEAMKIAGKSFLFVSQWGQSGIREYRISAGLDLIPRRLIDDSPQAYLGDVADFASVKLGNKAFLFAASAFDAGVTSFRVSKFGKLTQKDAVAPEGGSGFDLPQALDVIGVAGRKYLIMASAGTNSITVFKIGTNGQLVEKDQIYDTGDTRFQDASVLESFGYLGRKFLLAAGSDDGITLFELLPGGTLSVLQSLADTFDSTLQNVSAIRVVVMGAEIQVFVGSAAENGFTQFSLDFGNLGVSLRGSKTADSLAGTAGDDLIMGGMGRDFLDGAGGDDRIVDGRGFDRLRGGAGADIFQFVQDGKQDKILDFQIGIDRIDLSQFDGISHITSLIIAPRENGALIVAGDEAIRLETSDGGPLTFSDFSADDFIF